MTELEARVATPGLNCMGSVFDMDHTNLKNLYGHACDYFTLENVDSIKIKD
jgi:hypothetical protein